MNTLTKNDKETIISHFKNRLLKRYGIKGDKYQLQRVFKKRVQSGVRLQIDKRDKNKAIYVTRYQGKRILFVYNQQIDMVKTALTI